MSDALKSFSQPLCNAQTVCPSSFGQKPQWLFGLDIMYLSFELLLNVYQGVYQHVHETLTHAFTAARIQH